MATKKKATKKKTTTKTQDTAKRARPTKKHLLSKPKSKRYKKKTATENLHRHQWEVNHVLISKVYWQMVNKELRSPTIREIAEKTKLNESTVHKHIKELTVQKVAEKHKHALDGILAGLARAARAGDSRAATAYGKIVHMMKDDLQVRVSGNLTHTQKIIIGGKEIEF